MKLSLDRAEKVGFSIMVGLVVILIYFVYIVIVGTEKENKEWEEFKASHNCIITDKVAGKYSNSVGTGISSSGSLVVTVIDTSTPNRTGYKCNDGITYWREE